MTTILEAHPLADRFPLLEGDAYESFKASIATSGQKVDIVLFEEKILDGRNRYRACQELGTEPRFTEFTGTPEAAAVQSDVLNLHRRHLNRKQMRAVIAFKVKSNPERSDRDIAEEVKADHHTVAAERSNLESSGEIPQLATGRGRDGKTRNRKKKTEKTPVTTATQESTPEPTRQTKPSRSDREKRPDNEEKPPMQSSTEPETHPEPEDRDVTPQAHPGSTPEQAECSIHQAALPQPSSTELEIQSDLERVATEKNIVLQLAQDAVNCLLQIPLTHSDRDSALQIVVDFLKANRDDVKMPENKATKKGRATEQNPTVNTATVKIPEIAKLKDALTLAESARNILKRQVAMQANKRDADELAKVFLCFREGIKVFQKCSPGEGSLSPC